MVHQDRKKENKEKKKPTHKKYEHLAPAVPKQQRRMFLCNFTR